MKCWPKALVFTHNVGTLTKFRNLTDLATWNPGIRYFYIKNMSPIKNILDQSVLVFMPDFY